MTNKAIILGGGASIRQNLWSVPIEELPVWNNIKNCFTIGTNFVYKYFTPTVLMYSDYQFYASQKDKLKNIPLIIGTEDGAYNRKDGPRIDDNVILFKVCKGKKKLIWGQREEGTHPHYWGKDAWSKGFYTSQLIGLKALNLAIALNCDEIYLLGMDACEITGHTHFYGDTTTGNYVYDGQKHCGVGKHNNGKYKTGNYNKIDELNNVWYEPFKQELDNGVKIYNVSRDSKINVFPKISYNTFYKKILNDKPVDQTKIRSEIRRKNNKR